jgi:VanZ family protein
MNKILQYKYSITWSIVILILCSIPGNDLPKAGFINIPHFDKLVHFGFFIVLQTIIILETRVTNSVKIQIWIISALLCLLFGISIELLQGFVFTSRSMSIFDFFADTAGVLLAIPFILFIAIPFFRKVYKKEKPL